MGRYRFPTRGPRFRWLYPLFVLLFASGSLGAAPTGAVLWHYLGMLQHSDALGGLEGVSHICLSPDGRFLYAAGAKDNTLSILARDHATGRLSQIELLKEGDKGISGLLGPLALAISPDGRQLYLAGRDSNAVLVFSRQIDTGRLQIVQTVRQDQNGVIGLGEPWWIEISPDGSHLYVAGRESNAIACFLRDAHSGQLSFIGAQIKGIAGVNGLDQVTHLAISPDGRQLYACGFGDKTLATFQRDPASGVLAYSGLLRDGMGGVDGLNGAFGLAFSPDGRFLYVAAGQDSSISVFQRQGENGQLTYVESKKDGAAGLTALYSCFGVAASTDGKYLFVAANGDHAMTIFRRNEQNGKLTLMEVHKDGVAGVDGLQGARAIAISPDARHLYVAGFSDNAVAFFGIPALYLPLGQQH